MVADVLVEIDADKLSRQGAFDQIEAVGFACGLRGSPFPDVPGCAKLEYQTPGDVKRTVLAYDPDVSCTMRIVNVRALTLPLHLRAAATIQSGGNFQQAMFNKMVENVVRFYLETKLGLFGNIISCETYIGSPSARVIANEDFDASISFDQFGLDLLDFKSKIEQLIEQSSELSSQKHAFEAMGRVLQKQFAYVVRDIAIFGDEMHSLRELSSDRFGQLQSGIDRLESKQDEILSRLPPPPSAPE